MLAVAAPKAAERWLPEWASTDVRSHLLLRPAPRIIGYAEEAEPVEPDL